MTGQIRGFLKNMISLNAEKFQFGDLIPNLNSDEKAGKIEKIRVKKRGKVKELELDYDKINMKLEYITSCMSKDNAGDIFS